MIAQCAQSPPLRFPEVGLREYPHPEHLEVFRRIYKDIDALPFDHTHTSTEKRKSAEERGKHFAAERYGIDPEKYMAEVCSIKCATFVTNFAHRDLRRWMKWKEAWQADECSVDPLMWAQVVWAVLYPFSDKIHAIDS